MGGDGSIRIEPLGWLDHVHCLLHTRRARYRVLLLGVEDCHSVFFPCCAIINHPTLRTRNSHQVVRKKGLDDDQDEEPRCWIRGPQDTADFVHWCIGSSTKGQESSPLGFPFRLVPASPNARNRNYQHQYSVLTVANFELGDNLPCLNHPRFVPTSKYGV